MDAAKTERIDYHSMGAAAQPPDGTLGVIGGRRSFRTQGLDRRTTASGRGRATLARHRTLDHFFHITRRLRGHRSAQMLQARAGSVDDTSMKARSRTLSATDAAIAASIAPPVPLPLRFLPMMSDATLPPLVIPAVRARATDPSAVVPVRDDDAMRHLRARPWPGQLLSSVAHRLRYWTAPGERRKALRLAQLRERVTGAAYVFLNAMQSGEPLTRHFNCLQRQVRRLDRRVGVPSGISDESVRVLREAADRTAAVRETIRHRMLAFHREELLYDFPDTESFHHADGILLVMECRMVTGIALYGQALRCIAAADADKGDACGQIVPVMQTVVAREATVADGTEPPRQAWLGSAVDRLPYRTLVRLHAVLSKGLDCGAGYRDFLDELARVVGNKVGVPTR